ncbi:MAG: putative Ig domain-containing protein [Bacilli bacterium]
MIRRTRGWLTTLAGGAIVVTSAMSVNVTQVKAATLTNAPPVVSGWVQVSTPGQLEYLDQNQASYGNAQIELLANITLSSSFAWVPLGTATAFSGTFNGQGHTVSVTLPDETYPNQGFFGVVNNPGVVENVGVNVQITPNAPINPFNAQYSNVGGLVGELNGGRITNAWADGSIAGEQYSRNGGLVGYQTAGTITDAYADTNVSGNSQGLAVFSGNQAGNGGLVGFLSNGAIINAYAVGAVAQTPFSFMAGGLVGGVYSATITGATITGSFFDPTTTGQSSGVGYGSSSGVTSETTQNLQTKATFMNTGWNFTNIWGISPNINSGYPYLQNALSASLTPSTNNTSSNQPITVTGTVYYGATPVSGQSVMLTVPSGDGAWSNGSVTAAVYTSSIGQYSDTWTSPTVTNPTSVTLTSTVVSAPSVQQQSVVVVQPPLTAVPRGLQHGNVTQTGWTERWGSVTGASSYDVYLNNNQVGTVTSAVYGFTREQPGTTYQVTVASVNGAGTASAPSTADSVTTAVYGGGESIPPAILTEFFTEPAQVGQPYSARIVELDGIAPFQWKVTNGTLPPGLALDNQGVISGTPTGSGGQYTFTVQVTDANALSATKQLVLMVNPLASAPSITTTHVLVGLVGHSYTQTLAAAGGASPYTWNIQQGALPPGLNLDRNSGTISGTPSKPGVYALTVEVTDANGSTAIQALQLGFLDPNERALLWNERVGIVPAIVGNGDGHPTTYMPIWYVMQWLNLEGINSTWNGHRWNLTASGQPDLTNIDAGHGNTSIYLSGTLVQNVTTVVATDPWAKRPTTYMPIWYVMKLLNRVGLHSTWNGTAWTMTKENS